MTAELILFRWKSSHWARPVWICWTDSKNLPHVILNAPVCDDVAYLYRTACYLQDTDTCGMLGMEESIENHARNLTDFLAPGAGFLPESKLVLPCCCSSLSLSRVILLWRRSRKEKQSLTPLLKATFREQTFSKVAWLTETRTSKNKVVLAKHGMMLFF